MTIPADDDLTFGMQTGSDEGAPGEPTDSVPLDEGEQALLAQLTKDAQPMSGSDAEVAAAADDASLPTRGGGQGGDQGDGLTPPMSG